MISEKSKFTTKLEKLNNVLYDYDDLKIENKSSEHLINWFIEVVYKNLAIFKSKKQEHIQDQETYNKPRGNLFLIDFGKTIGSEFQDEHFAVVLKELDYTAVIIPLTSKKDIPPNWITNTDLIVDIGLVEGFPLECKECFAFIGGIQSVSKKRLSKYGDKKEKIYYEIVLSKNQMDLINENIIFKLCNKTIDISVII